MRWQLRMGETNPGLICSGYCCFFLCAVSTSFPTDFLFLIMFHVLATLFPWCHINSLYMVLLQPIYMKSWTDPCVITMFSPILADNFLSNLLFPCVCSLLTLLLFGVLEFNAAWQLCPLAVQTAGSTIYLHCKKQITVRARGAVELSTDDWAKEDPPEWYPLKYLFWLLKLMLPLLMWIKFDQAKSAFCSTLPCFAFSCSGFHTARAACAEGDERVNSNCISSLLGGLWWGDGMCWCCSSVPKAEQRLCVKSSEQVYWAGGRGHGHEESSPLCQAQMAGYLPPPLTARPDARWGLPGGSSGGRHGRCPWVTSAVALGQPHPRASGTSLVDMGPWFGTSGVEAVAGQGCGALGTGPASASPGQELMASAATCVDVLNTEPLLCPLQALAGLPSRGLRF